MVRSTFHFFFLNSFLYTYISYEFVVNVLCNLGTIPKYTHSGKRWRQEENVTLESDNIKVAQISWNTEFIVPTGRR